MYTVKRTRKTTIVIDYIAIAASVHSRFLVQREKVEELSTSASRRKNHVGEAC